jgi:hypothetical protein
MKLGFTPYLMDHRFWDLLAGAPAFAIGCRVVLCVGWPSASLVSSRDIVYRCTGGNSNIAIGQQQQQQQQSDIASHLGWRRIRLLIACTIFSTLYAHDVAILGQGRTSKICRP